jgi:glutathionyl-hydroquinone reductase
VLLLQFAAHRHAGWQSSHTCCPFDATVETTAIHRFEFVQATYIRCKIQKRVKIGETLFLWEFGWDLVKSAQNRRQCKIQEHKSQFYSTMNVINKIDGVHYTQQTTLFHAGVLHSKHNSFKNVTD